ncbi:hypothetical protein Tco_0824350 [Tanacetum coccineum]|uniref:Uncharacterized protein n=1 Tax=Tanacetum coccineum TaxID=301880 RepID=A0ABQ5APH3_9ASTR
MLCGLDFEPLSLSLSSMPSCDLVSLTNMLILLHYLESFKSELAEIGVLFPSAGEAVVGVCLEGRTPLTCSIVGFILYNACKPGQGVINLFSDQGHKDGRPVEVKVSSFVGIIMLSPQESSFPFPEHASSAPEFLQLM